MKTPPSNSSTSGRPPGALPLVTRNPLGKQDLPTIRCHRLGAPIVAGDWEAAVRALSDATPITMKQAWLAEPEPQFLPATVRTGWRDDTLWVLAELHDADIFNPVDAFNAAFFQNGDAFELFFRPVPQEAYYEFHVGPHNQMFQLRIPSAAVFQQPPELRDWKLPSPVFQSWTRVDASRQRWEVLAAVPFAAICENAAARVCREWGFSFSRYDYTRGRAHSCLSSTSPHAVVGFHRQAEWGKLRFAP
jgi:hypothetical protein